MDDLDEIRERAWLQTVVAEALKQYDANSMGGERLREDALRTQKELWEEVGPISGSGQLEQLADFMSYIGAMKQQKRSHVFLESQKEKYARIAQSPYFGRIDFSEDGGGEKSYYIGAFNLVDEGFDILVHDWRAPVSGMFYDFDVGPASYDCPKGTISGELTRKRQYKIAKGGLIYMFDSSLKIDDEVLQQILGKSADSKMKAIVTSIQREQNRAIRNESFQNLVVEGPAGSGKTSVALHRAAYLLYKHRGTVTEKEILIFSPNAVFNDYISNVLPELGEENLISATFEDFMLKALHTELKKEGYYERLEYLLAGRERPTYAARSESVRFKSSEEFRQLLKAYAEQVQKDGPAFSDLYFREKLLISAREQKKLFAEDYAFLPFARRLIKLKSRIEYLLKPMEDARKREVAAALSEQGVADKQELAFKTAAIVAGETKDLRERVARAAAFDLIALYRAFFDHLVSGAKEADRARFMRMRAFTLEMLGANRLYYEDQVALLYLQSAWGGVAKTSSIRFLIVDEAQDYTPLQFEIFRLLFGNASLTLLGDKNQRIQPFSGADGQGLEGLGDIFPAGSTMYLRLGKSYRSTLEITRFTRRLLGVSAPEEAVERHGEEPVTLGFPDEAALRKRAAEDIAAFQAAGFSSVGILTRTKREAEEVYLALRRKTALKATLSGDEAYARGAVVMPAYLAKGLEFDAVIVYNASRDNYAYGDERLYLYTACTRALHALRVYYTGEATTLLEST
ncbi:MAG: UvrD-helicase domain-containing protein [Eubacteriales bacterium]|nr:UvrD-helicase domain-containing protein [Eubacteriales bacterium]